MRIFSNFDTRNKSKTIQSYKQQFGENKVFAVSKSPLFFYVKVLLPFLFYLISGIIFLYGMYLFVGSWVFFTLLFLIVVFGLVVILFPILKRYIDYKMDFILITPKFLVRYNQEGIFKRVSKTIWANSIRTLMVRKSGLLYSIFNNWDIIFLAEGGGGESELEGKGGDMQSGEIWEIVFSSVAKPEKIRRMIVDVMELVG